VNVGVILDRVPGASVDEGFGPTAVDVPADRWAEAASTARDVLGCSYFDFLTGVDDPPGVRLVCHVVSLEPFGHLALRTRLGPGDRATTLEPVWAGAAWHEREVQEMFGVGFVDADGVPLDRPALLLPPGFEGHPLRKDFELGARLDRPWAGDA
jgi:NADH:ubiquinone oxidoreductase subunit C